MPEAKRPTTPRLEPAVFKNGSVLAGAVPVSSLKEERVKICIYGRNRSGKTTLACQFKKPLLLISAEPDVCGGATSVSDIDGVMLTRIAAKPIPSDVAQGIKVHGSAKLVAITQELSRNNPFATVVLDTATSLQDIVMMELMGWEKVPEINPNLGSAGKENYMKRAEAWREVMRPLLELSNCNVIVLAQEKDHNPPSDDFGGKRKILHTMQQGSFMAPALGATSAQWLQDNCGYVVQIYEDEVMQDIVVPQTDAHGKQVSSVVQKVGTGKRARHLRLLYHPNFAAGGRWRYNRDMPESVTAPDPQGLYKAMAQYIPALK